MIHFFSRRQARIWASLHIGTTAPWSCIAGGERLTFSWDERRFESATESPEYYAWVNVR